MVVVLAQLPLLGRRSLRSIRNAPEFPRKQSMIRGAKYGGWLAALAALPLMLAIWFSAALLPVLGSTVGIGLMLLHLLVTVGVGMYWPFIGCGASLKLWWEPVERDEAEWRREIARLEKWRESRAYVVLICGLTVATFAVGYVAYHLSQMDLIVHEYLH